jgi:hypothetical protein
MYSDGRATCAPNVSAEIPKENKPKVLNREEAASDGA